MQYDFLINRLNAMEKNFMAALDNLRASVQKLTTAVNSERALVKGLADLIRNNANDPVALQALADELDSDTEGLLADIAANTDLVTSTTLNPNP